MPNQADVALVILTLVLAVVAVVGHLLLGVLEWGERLLLALWGRRAVVRGLKYEHVRGPVRLIPHRGDST